MFLKRLTILFYVTIIMFMGSFILLFALNILNLDNVFVYAYVAYHDKDFRLMLAILAGVILISNLLFYRYFSVNVHRDKVIAFDNPAGRVSVSLMALEDLVKRVLIRRSEIKDARIRIMAAKKALDVKIRLAMKSEGNIPDLASRVQEQVSKKIQDIIGLEEPVNVSIYIGKILPENVSKDEPKEQEEPPTTVPFRGFRA